MQGNNCNCHKDGFKLGVKGKDGMKDMGKEKAFDFGDLGDLKEPPGKAGGEVRVQCLDMTVQGVTAGMSRPRY